ncbi:MAG: hypothetical protein ACT4PI_02620 [Actinomycetota bacterium]
MLKRVAFRGLALACLPLRLFGRFRRRRVVVYYRHPAFARKSEAIADLLRRRGFRTQVRSGLSLSMLVRLKSSLDLWIGFWNNVPFELFPKNYIFVNAEPLAISRWTDNVHWSKGIRNARGVWGYKRSEAEHVERLGVPFHFVPLGYAPYYETSFRRHNEGKKLPQDIDVLFFGIVSGRRQRMLEQLEQRGMNVKVLSQANPAYGEQLDEFLARTKIVLGIHHYKEPQAQIFDLARVDHPLSNGLFVVHEKPSAVADPVLDPAFEENVITCEYQDIPDTCARFLTRPQERASRSATAYEWFKSDYALDAFIPYESVQGILGRRAEEKRNRAPVETRA